MATTYLHQAIWANVSGLAADSVVNTFHSQALSLAEAQAFVPRIKAFYDTAHGAATNPITAYLARTLTGAVTVKTYDLSTAPPRSPVDVQTWISVLGTTTGPLPDEVALVASYKADPVPGVPAGRLRGRIYLGPFGVQASKGYVGNTQFDAPNRPLAALITTVAEACTYLATLTAGVGVWSTFSPTGAGAHIVTNGFVDNAWDTQRRRGVDPTARTLWT